MKLSKTSVDLLEDEIRKTVGKAPREGVVNLLRALSAELSYHKEYEISRLIDRLGDGLETPDPEEPNSSYRLDLYLLTSHLHKAADSREWEDITSLIQVLSLYLSHMDSRAVVAADRLHDVLVSRGMKALKGPT